LERSPNFRCFGIWLKQRAGLLNRGELRKNGGTEGCNGGKEEASDRGNGKERKKMVRRDGFCGEANACGGGVERGKGPRGGSKGKERKKTLNSSGKKKSRKCWRKE